MSQAPQFEFAPVTHGLEQHQIVNIFIPDYPGRAAGGETPREVGRLLAVAAAEVFLQVPPEEKGLIVCSDPDQGVVWGSLIRQGVPEGSIRDAAKPIDPKTGKGMKSVDPRTGKEKPMESIDPVTNFIVAQGLFNNNAPVGIITPPGLWAIHKRIGQRTMRRDFGGLLVEGLPDEHGMVHRSDARLSHRVSRGQHPRQLDFAKAQRRALRAQSWARRRDRSGNRFYGS